MRFPKTTLFLLFLLILFVNCEKQEKKENYTFLSGKIVYQVTLNPDKLVSKIKDHPEMSDKIKKVRLRRALNAEPMNFFLLFSGNESLYHSEFDIYMQRDLGTEINETSLIARDDYISYTNLMTKENFRQSFWKDNLIINVEPIQWQLKKETKRIGKYTCYKAIAMLEEESEHGGYLSDPIIAWYTPQIPVSFGVQNYGGLPGLTLELSIDTENGELFYEATKIELNPKDEIIIKKPKGKEISHKEFIEMIHFER